MHSSRQSTALQKRSLRWKTICICIGLAVLTWAVFIQTVRYDFVNYDDPTYVYQNTRITSGINLANVAWAFTHVHSENWHPLTTITHMLDCQLHGLNAGWHHFTNVLLHCLAVVLLFVALQQMTGALWRSAFVSAVFAVHPLHVESVAWIAERKDVLSAVFFMITLLAYLRYTRAPSIGRYLTVALVIALGLMSKPMLVTLPFVLLLLDYWPLGRFEARRSKTGRQALQLILEKVPLIALSAVSSMITFLAQRGAIGWTEQLPVSERISNAFVAYVVYIRQMFWPTRLAVFYPHPENRLPVWEISLALIVLVGITAAAFVLRKKSALFRDRLVVVSRNACASDWIGASRVAGTRRSLHIFAADRPLYCGYLGGNRFDSLMALSTDSSGCCCGFNSWCFKLPRVAPDVLLAR